MMPEKLKRTYNPCDECPYGIEKRDGSGNDSTCKICEFADLVKANRRAQQPNEPLTVDELRQMDGEPVWCTWIDGWALIYIDGNSELEFVYNDGSYHTFDELKNVLHECKLPFIAYRRPPEEGEKDENSRGL